MKHLIAVLIFVASFSLSQAQDLAEKLQNLSVTVHAGRAQGSGVMITRDGNNYVLTAGHVVDGQRNVTKFNDNATGLEKHFTKFESVKVVREIVKGGRSVGKMSIEADVIAWSSPEYGDDLALLKLRDPIGLGSVVFYKGEAIPATGTKICHVGSFLGQEGSNSFSEGLISQVGRVMPEAYDHVFDQSSATAFPGSSGGGIFNMQGEYIGTLVRGAGETFTFYVPIRRIHEWAKRHNVEFIFDEDSKPDESKIILEGIEPDSGGYRGRSTTKFLLQVDDPVDFEPSVSEETARKWGYVGPAIAPHCNGEK